MRRIDKEFGKRFTEITTKKGLNKTTLALEMNRSYRTVETWLSGENYPDISILKALFNRETGVFAPYGMDYLFGLIDEPNEESKTAAEYTGLSSEAIEHIRELKEEAPEQLKVLNILLSEHRIYGLLTALRQAAKAANDSEEAYKQGKLHTIEDYKLYELRQLEAFERTRRELQKILDSIPQPNRNALSDFMKDGQGATVTINKNRPNESERR